MDAPCPGLHAPPTRPSYATVRGRADERGEGPDEGRARVQRLRPAETEPEPLRLAGGLHVEVEQDLGVVGHEADRRRHHAAGPATVGGPERFFDSGPEP